MPSCPAILAACVLALCSAAPAQTQPPSAPPQSSAAELERRIAAAPDDDHVATWMLDLAELRLAAAMRACDDASVMFGIPTERQLRAVVDAGVAALELVTRAAAAANATVARLEASLLDPSLTPDEAAQAAEKVDPLLSTLLDRDLAVRVPALRTRAAAFAAMRDPHKPAGQTARNDALRLIADLAPANLRDQVHMRILAAAILLRTGEPQHVPAARRQVEWITDALAQDDADVAALAPADLVRIHMALARLGITGSNGKLHCPGRGEDWLVDLLLAEAALAATSSAPAVNDASAEARAAALAGLIAVVHKYAPGDTDIDSSDDFSALRSLVYEKIGIATGPGTPWASLHPEVALARAWSLHKTRGALDAEATSLLGQVADRTESSSAVRARALWILASESPAPRTQLARLVRLNPPPRLARLAASRLLELIPAVRDPSAECPVAWKDGADRADAVAALECLLASQPSDAGTLESAVAAALSGIAPAIQEIEQASAHLLKLESRQPEAAARLNRCFLAALERALAVPAVDPSTHQRLLALAEDWFSGRGNDAARAQLLRLDRIQAALTAKLISADDVVAQLQPLIATAMDAAGSPQRARLRVSLGIALRASGRPAQAVPMLRSVTDEFQADARSEAPHRAPARSAFWSAWSELIEMARSGEADSGRENGAEASDAERQRQAAALKQRLELNDPALGGEPWAGRIRAAAGEGSK